MAVNKVTFAGNTLIDLTADTVTADTLAVGVTAHDKSGKKVTGTMEAGIELPTLTNEGAAADLLSGKQLIDDEGNIVTGSMPSVTQATPSISVSTSGLITASATQSAGKVAAGTKSATKQLTVQAAQTITPGTSNKTIASGRYLTGTQTIKGDENLLAENIKSGVSIFGVVGSMEAGDGGGDDELVAAIDGSITEVSSSRVTKLCDYAFATRFSLKSANFPECSVVGSAAFSSCSALTTINIPKCKKIGSYAFTGCMSLESVYLPVCSSINHRAFNLCMVLKSAYLPECKTFPQSVFYQAFELESVYAPKVSSVGEGAFVYCNNALKSVEMPMCAYLGSSAFASCKMLEIANYPLCSYVGDYAFAFCDKLSTVILGCKSIRSYAFRSCWSLSAVVIKHSSVCSLANSNAFASASMFQNGTGYIYVPSSLVASYKAATNWTYYSSRISAIEDSPYA